VWDMQWLGDLTYGDVFLQSEIEHCKYYFEIADVESLKVVYDEYESEHRRALAAGAIIPSYDYVLKCSHLFNVLDTRGAIGVTERAYYFRRMRDMTRNVAAAYAEQRQQLEYPWMGKFPADSTDTDSVRLRSVSFDMPGPADLLVGIGTEELPAHDVTEALEQLRSRVPVLLDDLRLDHEGVSVMGTPRRLVVHVRQVAPRQRDEESLVKGPP